MCPQKLMNIITNKYETNKYGEIKQVFTQNKNIDNNYLNDMKKLLNEIKNKKK